MCQALCLALGTWGTRETWSLLSRSLHSSGRARDIKELGTHLFNYISGKCYEGETQKL